MIYGFMTFYAVPKLKKILEGRQSHIDSLLDVAKKFNEKSAQLKAEAESSFTKIKKEILSAEEELVGDLEKKNSEEKQKISKEIFENANREISALKDSSEEVFNNISSDLDELLDVALQKIGNQKL